ncbi:hypothetical protein SPFM12_00097 [Salmonella phage SPFM12]|nr:hypothetical protein SPFM12_00097 [Salmonella phage SPFM12]
MYDPTIKKNVGINYNDNQACSGEAVAEFTRDPGCGDPEYGVINMATGQAESMKIVAMSDNNRYLLVKTMGGVAHEYGGPFWCQNSDVQGGSCHLAISFFARAGSIELPKVVNDNSKN